MLIKKCEGVELEKSSPTSPEDAFNRSMVTFEADGRDRTFHLVYLRFFENRMNEFTPYDGDPLFTAGSREVTLKDVAALTAMIQHPEYQQRKRVYLHEEESFDDLFKGIQFDQLHHIFDALESDGRYELKSSIPFLEQPE
ncbi:MAG TPA: hypothetical protein VFK33_09120 [Bacillales bacterium]|nr:hypothetical protein [Bacillales bacterium]